MTFQMEDLKEFCKKTSLHGWRRLAMEDVSHQGSCQTSGEPITNITLMNVYIYTLYPFGHPCHPTQDFVWVTGRFLSCWHLLPLPSSSSPAPPTSSRWWSSSACITIYVLDDIGNLGERKTLMTLMMKRNFITQQTSMILILFDNIPQGDNCDVPGHTERPTDRVVLPLCCGLQQKPGNL